MKSGFWNGIYLFVLVSILGALTYTAAVQIPAVEVGVDDANIFYVYARNLSHGEGFVWNRGGERVEGFSSLLWVLLLAPMFSAGAIRPGTVIPLFNLFLLAIALFKLSHSMARCSLLASMQCRFRYTLPAVLLLMLLWILLTPRYLVWTVLSGMETGLWSALLMVATAFLLDAVHAEKLQWTGVYGLVFMMPLLIMTRPEGMLWCAVFCGLLWVGKLARGASIPRALQKAVVPAVAYLIAMGGLFLFRWLYFGSLFPNTYYAKVSPDRSYTLQQGSEYLLAFMRSATPTRIFVLLAPIALATGGMLLLVQLWRCWRTGSSQDDTQGEIVGAVIAASGVSCIGLLIPVLVGGDHFEWFRFYQPIWPLLPVPVFFLMLFLVSRWVKFSMQARHGLYMNTIFLMVFLMAGLFAVDLPMWRKIRDARIVQEFVLARDGRELGGLLTEVHADLPSVGSIAVGGVQFGYRGSINDLMGLNNVEMARHPGDRRGIKNHAAFSAEVFYRQLPEIVVPIIMRPEEELDAGGWRKALAFYVNHRWILLPLRNLPREARFQQKYVLAVVRRQTGQGPWLAGYYRRDYIEHVHRAGLHEVLVLPLDEE